MTLAQFFAATGVELSLVASDTTDGGILVLNHRTAPDCPVVWAVRMSMSIPLLWDEVVWQADWGTYLGRDVAGHAVVDGGLLSNFPIELFISDAPQVTKLMGPKKDDPVLGLLIDEKLPVAKGCSSASTSSPGSSGPCSGCGGWSTPRRARTTRWCSRSTATSSSACRRRAMARRSST